MEENDINPDAIAIIGIACKFPGASNKTEFWKNWRNCRNYFLCFMLSFHALFML